MFLGKGAVYSYDPVGCVERLQYSSSGAGEPLIQPFLDNQVCDFFIITNALGFEEQTSLMLFFFLF